MLTRISRDDFGLTKQTAARKGGQDVETTIDPPQAFSYRLITALYT